MLGPVPARATVGDDERTRWASLGRVLGHPTTVRDTVEGMSDDQPEALVVPTTAAVPPTALPNAIEASAEWPAPPAAPRARLNALAVAALVLAVLMSPLAALFGHLAAGQIARSHGRERGAVIAWIAVGLGYLWLVVAIIVGVVAAQLLAS